MTLKSWLCADEPIVLPLCRDCGGLPEGDARTIDPLALFAGRATGFNMLELRCGDCKHYYWASPPDELPRYRRSIAKISRRLFAGAPK